MVEEINSGAAIYNKPEVHGVIHAGVGVSNLENSIAFYKTVLGFDKLLYEYEGYIPEINMIEGRSLPMKLAILERSYPEELNEDFLPAGIIKLFEAPGFNGRHIYHGRRWGDIGCMELSFDVSGLENVVSDIKSKGIKIYLPPVEIDMGTGSKGVIAYIQDPDGTIIELVEIKSVAWLSLAGFRRFAIPLLKLYDRVTG
jgi:catechol 2,3-dioxygenase-like lactoylglutathione lyase family enzyme